MIDRILETEAMDSVEEAEAYDAMDHSAVNERFVNDFLAQHGTCQGGWYLDVGTGTAHIPIVLAQADPKARIVALDLAEEMLKVARRNIARAQLLERIVPRNQNARAIADSNATFEAVLSNSIIHHIPEPQTVLRELVRLVQPGGTLFVRDLARPASMAELEQLVETYAGKESNHARNLFHDSLHAALTLAEIREQVRPLGLPEQCVQLTSDRHWTLCWTYRA